MRKESGLLLLLAGCGPCSPEIPEPDVTVTPVEESDTGDTPSDTLDSGLDLQDSDTDLPYENNCTLTLPEGQRGCESFRFFPDCYVRQLQGPGDYFLDGIGVISENSPSVDSLALTDILVSLTTVQGDNVQIFPDAGTRLDTEITPAQDCVEAYNFISIGPNSINPTYTNIVSDAATGGNYRALASNEAALEFLVQSAGPVEVSTLVVYGADTNLTRQAAKVVQHRISELRDLRDPLTGRAPSAVKLTFSDPSDYTTAQIDLF